jgi:hypothetical protein
MQSIGLVESDSFQLLCYHPESRFETYRIGGAI